MKKMFVISLALFSLHLSAQETATSAPAAPTTTAPAASLQPDTNTGASGFRAMFSRPVLWTQSEYQNRGPSDAEYFDSAWAIAAGYSSFEVGQFGWETRASYIFSEVLDNDVDFGKIEASFGYAPNKTIYIKAGPNVSWIFESDNGLEHRLNAGLGLQTHFGVKFNRYIGMELGFVYMRQTGEVAIIRDYGNGITSTSTEDVTVQEYGPEIGVTGTF